MKFPHPRFRLLAVQTASILMAVLPAACAREPAAPPVPAILQFRMAKDAFMRDNPQSPFKAAPPVAFAPLKYFPPDAAWVFRSRLEVDPHPQSVVILDTKGQRREGVRYGVLSLVKRGKTQTLNVYRMAGPAPGTFHYAIWFTDRTTGDSTYEVGRYLDFEKDDDPAQVYTIDFNLAYNPYCAYSPAYACPIPRKDDHLDLAITAGEKKWHE